MLAYTDLKSNTLNRSFKVGNYFTFGGINVLSTLAVSRKLNITNIFF